VMCNWMIDEGWEVPDIWARVPSMSEVSWKDKMLSVFALRREYLLQYGYVCSSLRRTRVHVLRWEL
jgi:hypothetical protein